MRIVIGSDHGGFLLKQVLIEYLKKHDHSVLDVGCFSKESCDYPGYSYAVADMVSRKKADRGIAICKSGIGTSIVANKAKGARAALCVNPKQARSSREHNDANILVLGALYVTPAQAKRMLGIWLKTLFLGERHARRIKQIKRIESEAFKPI
jgi:ribose 5-phosphate isomerase B